VEVYLWGGVLELTLTFQYKKYTHRQTATNIKIVVIRYT